MPELAPLAFVALLVGALIIGVSKTALPGAGSLTAAIFATVLPAKESTATVLVLLILGDALALLIHRRHADWATLLRLAPAVVAGMVLGALFLLVADDSAVRRAIGVLLLAMLALTLWLKRRRTAPAPRSQALAAGYGSVGGFTTMVANAAGPVMSMYFLSAGFSVRAFLGTSAWFFAIVNVAKIPFLAGSGIMTWDTLALDLVLAPAVLVGAGVGWLISTRINQRVFEWIVLILTAVTAVSLLF